MTGFFLKKIMKYIDKFSLLIFLSFSIFSQEYIILVKSNKEISNQNKDLITLSKDEQIHYTLDKLLEKEIGFMIQKYGGEGSYSLIRIRGSNANQVNLYLNGIPLNFAAYSEVDVSDLHIFNYKSIEIEKNGSITGLTGSSIGGSINLIPELEEEKNQIYVQGGSYKTFGGGLFYQQLYKKEDNSEQYYAGWNVSFYRETSDQDYQFRNHNGTIYFNTIDDFNDKRKNAQYKKTSSLINGFVQVGNTKIQLLNDTFYRIHGIPGPITRQTLKTKREHLRNTSGMFTDTKLLFWDNVRLKSRVYYTYINNNFTDPENELSFGANSSKAFLHNKGIHLMPQVLWDFPSLNFLYEMRFLFGYEEEFFSEDKYTNVGFKTQDMPEKKRYHYSTHLSNRLEFFDGLLELVPEFRNEKYYNNFFIETQTKRYVDLEKIQKDESRIHFTNESYKIWIKLLKKEKHQLKFFLDYREEKRLPSFIELFGEKGSIVPNLKLRPESSFNREAGIKYSLNDFFFDLRIYRRDVNDLIQFIPNSQFSLRAENIEKAYFFGSETTLKYIYKKFIKLYLSYNYQIAKQFNKNNFYNKESYIPLVPMHTYKSGFIVFINQKWEYHLDAYYFGAYFKNKSNDFFSYQPPKWVYNASFYYKWKDILTIFLEVRNLQNHLYEDIIGYPLPGRNYVAGLKYFF